MTSPGLPKAFLHSVPIEGNGCLIWPYARNSAGYGHIRLDGRNVLVSRICCEMRNGPPPTPRHHAAHSCGLGHEGCIAPWHLSWKTAAGNCEDMAVHGTRRCGSAVAHLAKLNAEQVTEIRRLKGSLKQSEIGAIFGVTQAAISCVQRRKSWKHVE